MGNVKITNPKKLNKIRGIDMMEENFCKMLCLEFSLLLGIFFSAKKKLVL